MGGELVLPAVLPPRTVPVHILPLFKEELDRMKADDIICALKKLTDWENSIVCSVRDLPEGKKKVRLCLDPKELHKYIKREHYYTRIIDEILPQLHGKKHISVVDTKKGYWHVELDQESSLLCTFNTPFRRYRFKIVSQDIIQGKSDDVYRNIPGETDIANDIIVSGSAEEDHDQAMIKMLEARRMNNIELNSDKLQFKQKQVNFNSHTLSEKRIQPMTEKMEAISNLKAPSNSKELFIILVMVT